MEARHFFLANNDSVFPYNAFENLTLLTNNIVVLNK